MELLVKSFDPKVEPGDVKVLQHSVKTIRSITKQDDLSRIFGLHLRLEDDFLTFIADRRRGRDNNGSTEPESIMNEVITNALLCFKNSVTLTNLSTYWVYIASVELKNSTKC